VVLTVKNGGTEEKITSKHPLAIFLRDLVIALSLYIFFLKILI
jgi:hypothetical protein